MGTKTGYRLFSVTAVDKLDCIHEGGKTHAGSQSDDDDVALQSGGAASPNTAEPVVGLTLVTQRRVCSSARTESTQEVC